MKIPFDIDKAKAGAQVVTRSGKKVRILTFDKRINHAHEDPTHEDPIVGLINDGLSESVATFTHKGINGLNYNDLFIEVEPEYKPFDLSNAPVGRIVKSKTSGCKFIISSATNTVMGVGMSLFLYEYFLKVYVFEDGSPCGVLVS